MQRTRRGGAYDEQILETLAHTNIRLLSQHAPESQRCAVSNGLQQLQERVEVLYGKLYRQTA